MSKSKTKTPSLEQCFPINILDTPKPKTLNDLLIELNTEHERHTETLQNIIVRIDELLGYK